MFFLTFRSTISQNIKSCQIPESIATSRQTRLHHPCESNQNEYFAIESHKDFYCIFYSTLGIEMFGAETKFEIKVDGNLNYEQVENVSLEKAWLIRASFQTGGEDFRIDNNTMKMMFSARIEDVIIIIRKHNGELPTISSVVISDGALSDVVEKLEYCAPECGYQDESLPVILGGVEARSGAWPWNAGTLTFEFDLT